MYALHLYLNVVANIPQGNVVKITLQETQRKMQHVRAQVFFLVYKVLRWTTVNKERPEKLNYKVVGKIKSVKTSIYLIQ